MKNGPSMLTSISAVIYDDGTALVRMAAYDPETMKLRYSTTFESSAYLINTLLPMPVDAALRDRTTSTTTRASASPATTTPAPPKTR